MKIELASVGSTPRPLAATFSPTEIDLEGEATLTGDAVLKGEIVADEKRIRLTGSIGADLELGCTRCLEPVRHTAEIDFEDIFIGPEDEPLVADAEVPTSDLDESIAVTGEIDLAETVREQILLALPEQIYCRDDCKGLCPQCGSNRNLIDCSCAREEIDPRWAALKDLN